MYCRNRLANVPDELLLRLSQEAFDAASSSKRWLMRSFGGYIDELDKLSEILMKRLRGEKIQGSHISQTIDYYWARMEDPVLDP